jgi:hypothetical protein
MTLPRTIWQYGRNEKMATAMPTSTSSKSPGMGALNTARPTTLITVSKVSANRIAPPISATPVAARWSARPRGPARAPATARSAIATQFEALYCSIRLRASSTSAAPSWPLALICSIQASITGWLASFHLSSSAPSIT